MRNSRTGIIDNIDNIDNIDIFHRRHVENCVLDGFKLTKQWMIHHNITEINPENIIELISMLLAIGTERARIFYCEHKCRRFDPEVLHLQHKYDIQKIYDLYNEFCINDDQKEYMLKQGKKFLSLMLQEC